MTTGSVRVLLSRARRQVRDGYGMLAAPVVGLVARWRARWAGLGDAVPVALAAPAMVVVVVAGVVLPSDAAPAPQAPATSIAVAPSPTTAMDAAPAPAAPAPKSVVVAPVTDGPTAAPAATASDDTPATGPGVELPGGSAGFADQPPTDDERDKAADTPSGPVEGIDVYLEETGLGGLDESCSICP